MRSRKSSHNNCTLHLFNVIAFIYVDQQHARDHELRVHPCSLHTLSCYGRPVAYNDFTPGTIYTDLIRMNK